MNIRGIFIYYGFLYLYQVMNKSLKKSGLLRDNKIGKITAQCPAETP
jgi:hypothetical protein